MKAMPKFIKKSIASGTLGSTEASTVQAVVDAKKTGGMFLRSNAEERSAHSRFFSCKICLLCLHMANQDIISTSPSCQVVTLVRSLSVSIFTGKLLSSGR